MPSKLGLAAALLALVPGGMAGTPAQAQGASRYAESMCKDRLRDQYRASGFHSVTTSQRGGDRYHVSGNVDRGDDNAWFTCDVAGSGVRNVEVGSWSRKSGGGGGGAVAAVGAAVVLGAIIAAAASKKKSHEYDRYNDGYDNGYGGGNSYSPSSGINCYRDQRACFDAYNNYSPRWTSREFDY